jgi:CO/xanthine dehydrogenase Mo-binding subunit
MDVIAARLGLDRIELRRRNLIAKSAMPYDRGFGTLGTDVVYDSGDYAMLIDKLLAASGWDAMQKDCARRRAAGELAGCGFGMFVEKSGLGPFDKVRIEVAPSGHVELITGVASIGQGVETAMAQICAETLGVDYRGITVTHGQTDRIDRGMGAFASRVTVMCGEATRMAAVKLRETALAAAAELMQTTPDALDIINGEIVRTGMSGPSMTLGALAESRAGKLTAEAEFKSSHMVYPYGAHVVQVKLDADTGGLAIERYVVAYDVGRAVNPKMIEGQILGGVAQGLGGALYEEFRYDESGEPLSVTFADYLMPTAHEMPAVDVIVTEDAPSPLNPLGLKGAGEGGITPVGAAIASAIDDAIQQPGAITEIPVTPQRLKELIGRG